MTFPNFAAGEVLTSADMNAVGLWLVKTQTIGSGVTSVVCSDAFSANYDNYKIVISGGVTGSPGSITMQLNNSTGSTYRMYGYYGSFSIATLNPYGPTANTLWTDIGIGNNGGYMANIDLFSPFLSKPTLGTTWTVSVATAYHFALVDSSTASNTGFTLTGLGGNSFTGGTIRVYGMRN